jgi:hypothetical protein
MESPEAQIATPPCQSGITLATGYADNVMIETGAFH